jgi:hypothetical protein
LAVITASRVVESVGAVTGSLNGRRSFAMGAKVGEAWEIGPAGMGGEGRKQI